MTTNNNTLVHKYIVPLIENIDFDGCENNSNIKAVISKLMTIAKNTMKNQEEPGNTTDVKIDELKGAVILDKKDSKTDEPDKIDKTDKTKKEVKPNKESDQSDENEIEIKYNSETYNLENSNDTKLFVKVAHHDYQSEPLSQKKLIINFTYDNIRIKSNYIHHIYVILQHIYNKKTLIQLSKDEWDYSKWKVQITSDKNLPSWAKILNCLLNRNEFNTPIEIKKLEEEIKLNDKRGWGGERSREVYYKLGFPLYTSKTNKNLKNGERLFECPFPICKINPKRKAIISVSSTEIRCFTCNRREGDQNIFGNICHFEKGHFEPHINGGVDTATHQCKWCNTFYKDKIIWNPDTGKPKFNSYAILRDAPKNEIIDNLKILGFTSKDLE
jgi:hypothetical protein